MLFKLLRNIAWMLVVIFIVFIIYTYVSCWSMASTSAFCTSVKALPFPWEYRAT